jgi:acyl transferase domain-containing protein
VGLSCRFPGADSVDEYWDVLINGRDMIQKVPDHRWPSAKTSDFREIEAGFLKCPVDTFDGKFFGISPADLYNTDPQQRLLMEVVWEALEDAGLNAQSLKGTPTGVFVGSWTSDYRDLINDNVNVSVDNELSEFHRLYMGNSLGIKKYKPFLNIFFYIT